MSKRHLKNKSIAEGGLVDTLQNNRFSFFLHFKYKVTFILFFLIINSNGNTKKDIIHLVVACRFSQVCLHRMTNAVIDNTNVTSVCRTINSLVLQFPL